MPTLVLDQRDATDGGHHRGNQQDINPGGLVVADKAAAYRQHTGNHAGDRGARQQERQRQPDQPPLLRAQTLPLQAPQAQVAGRPDSQEQYSPQQQPLEQAKQVLDRETDQYPQRGPACQPQQQRGQRRQQKTGQADAHGPAG